MKKIFLAATFILFVGISWFGYKWLSIKHLNENLTQEAKAAMVTGIMETKDILTTGIGKNFIKSDGIFWSDINVSIERVLTSTQILKKNYN